jgi:hypothetical protein
MQFLGLRRIRFMCASDMIHASALGAAADRVVVRRASRPLEVASLILQVRTQRVAWSWHVRARLFFTH